MSFALSSSSLMRASLKCSMYVISLIIFQYRPRLLKLSLDLCARGRRHIGMNQCTHSILLHPVECVEWQSGAAGIRETRNTKSRHDRERGSIDAIPKSTFNKSSTHTPLHNVIAHHEYTTRRKKIGGHSVPLDQHNI